MQLRSWLIAGSMASIIALFSGCTSLSLPSGPQSTFQKQSWQHRHVALATIQHWDITGAISIRQPNHSSIANYTWQQQSGKTYRLRIYSSLGAYSVVIAGKPGHITLQSANNKTSSASNPEQLMQEELGWRLPLSNLFYWMRGLPAPGKYHALFDSYGHITSLKQGGWQVQFSEYVTVKNVDLPRILQLTNGPLIVRIAIKQWEI